MRAGRKPGRTTFSSRTVAEVPPHNGENVVRPGFSRRRRVALIASVLMTGGALVAGCASIGGAITSESDAGHTAIEAPRLTVGTRWVYRARDGFRAPLVWTETREIVAQDANGYTLRVTQRGPGVDTTRTETLASPGIVRVGALLDAETRQFKTPLERYRFPLVPGKTWNQWIDNYNETTRKAGQINHYVRVEGWDRVATPAGTFDAIKLRVLMRLDDDEFWREPTTCNDLIWYAPAVGAPVREEKDAQYRERGDQRDGIAVIPVQHALLELESYTPGSQAQ